MGTALHVDVLGLVAGVPRNLVDAMRGQRFAKRSWGTWGRRCSMGYSISWAPHRVLSWESWPEGCARRWARSQM
eukprot:14401150-Alexandrium_andersonii.AAC.1